MAIRPIKLNKGDLLKFNASISYRYKYEDTEFYGIYVGNHKVIFSVVDDTDQSRCNIYIDFIDDIISDYCEVASSTNYGINNECNPASSSFTVLSLKDIQDNKPDSDFEDIYELRPVKEVINKAYSRLNTSIPRYNLIYNGYSSFAHWCKVKNIGTPIVDRVTTNNDDITFAKSGSKTIELILS